MLICEIDADTFGGDPIIPQIQSWLDEKSGQPGNWQLAEVANHAGGWKHPQFEAWCGGFNFFEGEAEEFAQFVVSREWSRPENVVLIIEHEERDTMVYRPPRYA